MTEKIIEKISSYNLLNYLLPGVLFMMFAPSLYDQSLLKLFDQNLITSLFLAYFIGMVISRFGSVLIEYVLKKIRFIKFAEYKDFVEASKIDPKIEIFSEQNNVYRTLIALFILLIVSYPAVYIIELKGVPWNYFLIGLFLGCLILFIFSYGKQVKYITGRVYKVLNR